MDNKELFDQFYENNDGQESAPSLIEFFETQVRHRLPQSELNILDIGCGTRSIFEDVNLSNARISAIDFSRVAIAKTPRSKIHYAVADISENQFFPKNSFDLIFDSHCFNCLTNDNLRLRSFCNVYEGLKPNGLFVSELMIQSIDKNTSMPHKKIRTSFEQENEILKAGFKILYFIMTKKNFTTVENGVEKMCDVLRVIATK